MKRLKPVLWGFFLCLVSLHAEEESRPLYIDSEHADYNGKVINLEGHAIVDHELGKVEAEKMTLHPETTGKKLRFAYLTMNKDVKITLHDGGELSCSEAEIDYQKLTGRFSGGEDYVVYTEPLKSTHPKTQVVSSTPLNIQSKEMGIRLQLNQQQSSHLMIDQITADDQVSIGYKDFLAKADHGVFDRKELSEIKGDKNKVGCLSLRANDETGICQISNLNGDLIHAQKINLDTSSHELEFESPKGSLFINHSDNREEIDFSCGSMAWNESQDVLILREQVEVNYKGMGTLTNPQEIQLHRKLFNGRKQLSLIDCIGQTELHYQDEKKHENHTLTTFNRLILDHQRMQAHLDSPCDADHQILENKQVHFSDAMGEIYADEIFINYAEVDKKMTPVKLILKGNVWLLGRTSVDKEDPGKILQFAIADRAEYEIAKKELLCMADFNKRVLFFDKNNNLQISAPSVKAKRDANTQKDSIQGIGDVRFSFIEKEFEQMKKRFEGMGYES